MSLKTARPRILLSLFLSVLSSYALFGSGHIVAATGTSLTVCSPALPPVSAAGYARLRPSSRIVHPGHHFLTVDRYVPKDRRLASWMPVSTGQQFIPRFFYVVIAGRSPPFR